MWHTHCATVGRTSEQLPQFFCALGTKVDRTTNLRWKPFLYFTNAWPISLEILLECCLLVWPTERERVCNSLWTRAMAYSPIHLHGWIPALHLYHPPWLLAWASCYSLPWVSVVSLNSCDIRTKCYLCLTYRDWGHCFALCLTHS